MQGKVLAFDQNTGSGVISGSDGNRYPFVGEDIMAAPHLMFNGKDVDFQVNQGRATDIFIIHTATGNSKNKIVAALLAFFFGLWGVHKFYLGQTTGGIILLLCGTVGWLLVIPPFVAGLIALIEAIIYLIKSDDEFYQDYVVNQKKWF